MTEIEPDRADLGASGAPARPPGHVPPGYTPLEWVSAQATTAASGSRPAVGPPPGPTADEGPFLDRPGIPPATKAQAGRWLLFAVGGFLVGEILGAVFGVVAGSIAGKTSLQMSHIASASVPPEWYVVSTLVGLWIGFGGAPWAASRWQGTRHFVSDLGLRFRWIDLVGIAIGLGGQLVVGLIYLPFRHVHNFNRTFNGPSQKLTGGSHGGGFLVIALATVVLAPLMEELFFRGLLFKALARLFTPVVTAGRARGLGVVLAVILDGLLFGLAHGEWIQLAGLALFGMALATISYRTGRLGMNIVSHASFNLVAILAIAYPSALIH